MKQSESVGSLGSFQKSPAVPEHEQEFVGRVVESICTGLLLNAARSTLVRGRLLVLTFEGVGFPQGFISVPHAGLFFFCSYRLRHAAGRTGSH